MKVQLAWAAKLWFTRDLQSGVFVQSKNCGFMKNSSVLVYFLSFFVFVRLPLHAELVLPHLFSDHMVMQREVEIWVWGRADAGEKISASLGAIAVAPQAETLAAAWEVCSPGASKRFSAVSYFFARDLHKALGVPVGIILSAWPGTAGEEWTDPDSLRREPALKPIVERWDASAADMKSYAAHPTEFSIEFDDFELLRAGNDLVRP
jgi:hypothetical protein